MEVTENVRTLCAPVVDELGIELYDVERAGGILRVTVDSPGGVSLDQVAEATRRISRLLDEHDPVPGRYTLEVTSPGLERTLRTPEHFRRAVGMQASVRVRTADGRVERLVGSIVSADDEAVTLAPDGGGAEVRVGYDSVDRARTVFEWGASGKGSGTKRSKAKSSKTRSSTTPATPAGGREDVDDGDDNEVSS
jgi:ribosome maturation factor RimP